MNGIKTEEQNVKDTYNSNSMMDSSTIQVSSSAPTFEIVRQQRFEVGPRYTDLKFIGEGAYGKCMNKTEILEDILFFDVLFL